MGMNNNTRSGRRWRIRALLAPVLLMSTGLTIGSAGSAHANDVQHGNPMVCGGVLTTAGATYTLQHDLGPCPNGGLTIAANNITLDLAGRTIRGCEGITEADPSTLTANPQCAPVLVNGDGIGVKLLGVHHATVTSSVAGGTIRGFDTGVSIDRLVNTNALGVAVNVVQSNDNTVEYLIVDSNIGNDLSLLLDTGEGIAVSGDRNVIKRNTVTNNGPFGGIRVLTPTTNGAAPGTSRDNVIGGSCSSATSTDGNTVDNNDVDYNSAGVEQGIGIGLEPGTHESEVCHNKVSDSGLDGITVFANSKTNIIKYNTVERNGIGNVNTTNTRHGDGIRLFTSTPLASNSTIDADNIVSNNHICGSAASGLRVDSYGNTISSNTSGTGTTPAGSACTDNHQEPSPTPPLPAAPPATPYDLHDTVALASNSSSTACGPASPLNNNWTGNTAPSIGTDPSAYNNACTIKP